LFRIFNGAVVAGDHAARLIMLLLRPSWSLGELILSTRLHRVIRASSSQQGCDRAIIGFDVRWF
jgi:hypothetical protein